MPFAKSCILFFSFFLIIVFAQSQPAKNILLVHSNGPIDFQKVDSGVIHDAVEDLIRVSNMRANAIIKTPKINLLTAFDELQYNLTDLSFKLELISNTFANENSRNAAVKGSATLSQFATTLFLNEQLYKVMKRYTQSSAAAQLHPNQKKYLNEIILNFENNGMKLDSAGRKRLEAINNKIINLGLRFDRNIADFKDSIIFAETELEGVPDNVRQKWKRPSGNYVLSINTPNYQDIQQYAASDATRHSMLLKYLNRAYPQNLEVLDSILYYRYQYANTLGFKSYAEYALTTKMAAKPANVWEFEHNLTDKLAPGVTADVEELKELKHKMHPELADTIYLWDVSYYKKQLLDSKYQLNTDEVKEYFEMNNTVKGMFTVYSKLFGLEFKETKNVPVWFDKVKTFEMLKDGKKIGSFYFDFYPRPNKYTHFACFPISLAASNNGKNVLPAAALVCNFPEGTEADPTLMSQNDLRTLFHEFGHLVHLLVVRSDIASQPYSIKPDFIEAPSQFLENWCWEYASLKMFARHYKTGAVLPESLFDKMKKTQMVQTALGNMTQVYYGTIDFTFEDKYDSLRGKNITQVSKDLYKIQQLPFPEGTHFICSFTHLNGYGANYYGYLWSKVFAQDMFSVFQKNGVMDTNTGIRYRKEILEIAGSINETQMLRNFLGREPNADAFMKSLGIKSKAF